MSRAYLVRRNQAEFGSVYELDRTRRLGLGRANTNFIVISDDGCSRNHAEVYFAGDRWRIQDLGSLNGTRLNDRIIESPTPLREGDVITIGQTVLVYMEDLSALKVAAPRTNANVRGNVSIVRRQDQTQTLKQVSTPEVPRPRSSKDLQTLYRLALRMGAAMDTSELARAVLDGLLEATAADSGGIIRIEDGMESSVLGYRTAPGKAYHPPPTEILAAVCSESEAILGQVDVDADSDDSNLRTGTLICTPVTLEKVVVAVLYLYTTDPYGALTSDDLDLTVTVAQQIGPILNGVER
ncbi:MAG: FHA domain-containing protein, partial [Planctomycetota bacterium]